MAMASKPMLCRGCWEQMHVPVPIRGPLAPLARLLGIQRSNMNPDVCTVCESMFEKVMRRRNIIVDLTILFADLRGFTEISEAVDQDRLRGLLDFFYDECAAAIWEQDGLLNKTIGDAVMAIFNFPLGHADHPVRAVGTAREIQRRCAERCKRMSSEAGLETRGLGVGIGIHTGPTAFGEFGTAHRELTAIVSVVNIAARLQAAAGAGEVLVTRAVVDRLAAGESKGTRECALKGLVQPITAFLV